MGTGSPTWVISILYSAISAFHSRVISVALTTSGEILPNLRLIRHFIPNIVYFMLAPSLVIVSHSLCSECVLYIDLHSLPVTVLVNFLVVSNDLVYVHGPGPRQPARRAAA